jgi:hypothetical protein
MSAETTRTRRSMLVGLGAAAAASAVAVQSAGAQTAGAAFRATRHPEDSWLDAAPGAKHRIVIDAPTPHGAGEAVLFASNLYDQTKAAYKGTEKDLAIVIVLRHFGTPFGYNDAFWAKYGKPVGTLLEFNDPKTKQPPSINVFNSEAYGMELPNFGNTLDKVQKLGTRFAICDAATHFIASQLAGSGGNADAIYKELVASILPGSRMVSAGVVAVTRAQEYGYSLIYSV